jgi:predicted phage baseplate assembly protein
MSCEHDCERPADFPALIFNRPALPRIGYRVGGYAEMRAHMLALIDQSPALSTWTHRGPDDPGIALIESAAIVGDILSLYQEDYANETWLRTALRRDAITDLVRLLGYRPAPGLGGRARFALAVKGDRPVRVSAGLQLKAQLEGADAPATFETETGVEARPALSEFRLYRPRSVPSIVNGMKSFEYRGSVELKAGDKLMVGLAKGDAANAAYDHTQILIVDKVTEAFGIKQVTTKGSLESLSSLLLSLSPVFSATTTLATSASSLALSATATAVSSVFSGGLVASLGSSVATVSLASSASFVSAGVLTGISALPAYSGLLQAGLALASAYSTPRLVAWKLGNTHRHFGHAAPASRVQVDVDGRATEIPVPYTRVLNTTQGDPAGPQLGALQLPIEGEDDTLTAGLTVLVEANLMPGASGTPRKRLLARRVRQLDRQSLAWGAQTGAATVLMLDADLAINEGTTALTHTDIRGVSAHLVQGAAFELRALPVNTGATEGSKLDFYGDEADAQALLGRTLLMTERSGPVAAQVQLVRAQTSGEPRWEITLDRTVGYARYGHDEPAVWNYANLVEASEGKTEADTVLGDGDARTVFQTFALLKSPLTYLLDTTVSPPQLSEIEIRVDGMLWQRVESFFDAGPRDAVYIVRESDDGKSHVQFGDGQRGARLPSGRGNVIATYRSGSGAHGPLKVDAQVSAQPRFAGFDAAFLHEPVTGGAQREPEHSVKRAAPGTMQSLGRIVSLADYETEAQSLPGVLKARASWTLLDGAPVLALTVLTDGLAAADATALDAALRAAVAARGPARCALTLRLGNRRFVTMGLRVGFDARLRSADVAAAVHQALGSDPDDVALDDLPSGGLFDWRGRQFGQDVHGSQIVGRVQNVPGVAWVELTRLGFASTTLLLISSSVFTGSAFVPASLRRVVCPATSLLGLKAGDLALEWVGVEPVEGRTA